MVICMNIGTDGNRYIARIVYTSTLTTEAIKERAELYTSFYDEVYVVDFNNNCEDFINEIVLKGCRV